MKIKLKWIVILCVSTIYALPTSAQAPTIFADTTAGYESLIMYFLPHKEIFYGGKIGKIDNSGEIARFKDVVGRYAKYLKSGEAVFEVEGFCSGDSLQARMRSLYVKSYLIKHYRLKEEYFRTTNHHNVTDGANDIVVLTIPVWASEAPADAPKVKQEDATETGDKVFVPDVEVPLTTFGPKKETTPLEDAQAQRDIINERIASSLRDLPDSLFAQKLRSLVDSAAKADSLAAANIKEGVEKLPSLSKKDTMILTGRTYNERGLPYGGVTIYTKSPMISTTSNSEGRFVFNFPDNFAGDYLYVSALGYKSDSVWIDKPTGHITIRLRREEPRKMKVMKVRDIMQKAFESIPQNYPQQPSKYEVFYREANRTLDGRYVAIAEAMLQIYKDPYRKKNADGQVKITKSRKSIIPGYDTIVYMHFYGGAFAYVNKDYVLKRAKLIDPEYFGRFSYYLKGSTTYDGRDVYVIDFKDRMNSNVTGRFYIDGKTWAYIRIDVTDNKGLKEENVDRTRIAESVMYMPDSDGRWYLHEVKYSDSKRIVTTGLSFDGSVEQLATMKDTGKVAPIPRKERLSYEDAFYDVASNYNPNFWSGYNVLQQDETMRRELEALQPTEEIDRVMSEGIDKSAVDSLRIKAEAHQDQIARQEQREARASGGIILGTKSTTAWRQESMSFGDRIFGGIGLGYHSTSSPAGSYSVNIPGLTFIGDKPSEKLDYTLDAKIGLHITSTWDIYWTGLGFPSSKLPNFTQGLGTEYFIRLVERRDNEGIFLGLSADLTWGHYNHLLGTVDNTAGSVNIDGETFDSDKIDLLARHKKCFLTPGVSVMGKINRMFGIELFLKYDISLTSSNYLRFKEKGGFFLSRKRADTDISNLNAIDNDGNPQTDDFIDVVPFRAGVILRFR